MLLENVNVAVASPVLFLFHWSMIGFITVSIILLVLYREQISFSHKGD